MAKTKLVTSTAAILEVMWGATPSSRAPGWFKINPYNHSGCRLYKLIGHKDLWVTNACDGIVGNPKGRGKPNPERLRENLDRLQFKVLLVCGRVAQRTLDQSGYLTEFDLDKTSLVFMPHPAARNWSVESMQEARRIILWAGTKPGRIVSTYEEEFV